MGLIRAFIAVIITIFVVFTIFSHYGNLDYLRPVFNEASDLLTPETPEGNISFTLTSDTYKEILFDAKKINLSFDPTYMTLVTKGGKVTGTHNVDIREYSGDIIVNENSVKINGTFKKITITDFGISFESDTVEIEANFSILTIERAKLQRLSMEKINGNLQLRGLDINITNQDVNITAIEGDFVFSEGLRVDGNASEIAIPEAEILIK